MVPGTIFNLRSMTKPIVGSIAQRQVNEQRLDLDAPAGQYLSSFAEGASADIVVRQLLTHTSGLPVGNDLVRDRARLCASPRGLDGRGSGRKPHRRGSRPRHRHQFRCARLAQCVCG